MSDNAKLIEKAQVHIADPTCSHWSLLSDFADALEQAEAEIAARTQDIADTEKRWGVTLAENERLRGALRDASEALDAAGSQVAASDAHTALARSAATEQQRP